MKAQQLFVEFNNKFHNNDISKYKANVVKKNWEDGAHSA